MKILILEDEIGREPRIGIIGVVDGHDFVVAKSCDEAKRLYTLGGPFDLLLLDHDLEGYYEMDKTHPNTGFEFVKWLTKQTTSKPLPSVIIHSWNNVGAKRMSDGLRESGYDVQRVPFSVGYLTALGEYLTKSKRFPVVAQERDHERDFHNAR